MTFLLSQQASPVSWILPNSLLRGLISRYRNSRIFTDIGKSPESVILGTKSYQKIANYERAQLPQKFLSFKYSLIFIGCGDDGLSDDNLGKLKVWLHDWNGLGKDHFHLLNAQDWKQNKASSARSSKLNSVKHPYPPAFLRGLHGQSTTAIQLSTPETRSDVADTQFRTTRP